MKNIFRLLVFFLLIFQGFASTAGAAHYYLYFPLVFNADRPTAFSKSSPANGATGQPSNPTLSWGTSSGATGYEYCYDTTNDSSCDGAWISNNTGTSIPLSGLNAGTTYYWQVRARNAAGTTDANGGWWSFTTDCTPFDLVFLSFGDSITQGYMDSNLCSYPSCGYPIRLYDRLVSGSNKRFGFYNVGIGGERTTDGLNRFLDTITNPQIYDLCPCSSCSGGNFYPEFCHSIQSEVVIIMEGMNDLGDWAANGAPSFDVIEDNLRTMVLTAQQYGKQVIIATINPVVPLNDHRSQQAQAVADFNQRIWQIANYFQIPVADIYSAFLNYPDWENHLMFTESGDGIHPNDLGFEVMADAFYQTILSLPSLSR